MESVERGVETRVAIQSIRRSMVAEMVHSPVHSPTHPPVHSPIQMERVEVSIHCHFPVEGHDAACTGHGSTAIDMVVIVVQMVAGSYRWIDRINRWINRRVVGMDESVVQVTIHHVESRRGWFLFLLHERMVVVVHRHRVGRQVTGHGG